MIFTTLGRCDMCTRLLRLRADGTVPRHYLSIPVSARAVRTVGTGRVKRLCSGSGRLPRRIER